MSHLRTRSGGTRVFLVSGVDEEIRKDLAKKIHQLGGKYFDLKYFKAICTHVICGKLSKSEKFLGGCACGKWVLHPDYIYQSVAAGVWLDEEQFEWCDERILRNYSGLEQELVFASRRWRFMLAEGHGAFSGWKVAVVAGETKSKAIKRLLISGGAEVFNLKLPVKNPNTVANSLGYIFVSEKNVGLVAHLFDFGVLCIKPEFIGDFLLKDPQPEPMEYLAEQVPTIKEEAGSEETSTQDSFLMETQLGNSPVTTSSPAITARRDSYMKCSPVREIQSILGEEAVTYPRKSQRSRQSTPAWQQLIPRTRVDKREASDDAMETNTTSDIPGENMRKIRNSSPMDCSITVVEDDTTLRKVKKKDLARVSKPIESASTGLSPGSAIVLDDSPVICGSSKAVTSIRPSIRASRRQSSVQEKVEHIDQEVQTEPDINVCIKTEVKREPMVKKEPGVDLENEAITTIDETANIKYETTRSSTPCKALKGAKSIRSLISTMSPITAFFKPVVKGISDTDNERNQQSSSSKKKNLDQSGLAGSGFRMSEPRNDQTTELPTISRQPTARKSLLGTDEETHTPHESSTTEKKADSEGMEPRDSLASEITNDAVLKLKTASSEPQASRGLPQRARRQNRALSAPVATSIRSLNDEAAASTEPIIQHQITASGDSQSTNEVENMEVDHVRPIGDGAQENTTSEGFVSANSSIKRKANQSPGMHQLLRVQKRQKVSSSEWRPIDLCIHYREEENLHDSQPMRSVHTQIIRSLFEEEEFIMVALQELNARICNKYFPSAETIALLVHKFLPTAENDLQASLAHKIMMKMLRIHPPVTIEMQQVYLKALAGNNEERRIGQEWLTIQTCIRIILFENDRTIQKNHVLLFNFIHELLQQNLQHYVLNETVKSGEKHMWLRILWCPSYHVVFNSRCQELLDLLDRTIGLYRTKDMEEDKTRLMNLLQDIVWLVSMAAESCRLQEAKVVTGIKSLQQEKVSGFVSQISRKLIDAKIQDKTLLRSILSAMQLPWLCVGVCQQLLNELDDHLVPDNMGIDSTSVTLSVIVSQYFFLVPRLNRRTDTGDTPSAVKTHRSSMERKNSSSPTKRLFDNKDLNQSRIDQQMKQINKKNPKGETQLHRACIAGNLDKVKQLLKGPGIDVNAKDNCGWTPLHEACNRGRIECVRELLRFVPSKSVAQYLNKENNVSKVDILASNVDGITPLHDAVHWGHLEVSRLLLQHGGSKLLSAVTTDGYKPLDLAVNEEMRAMLCSFEPVQRKASESQELIGSQDSIKSIEEVRTEMPSSFLYDEVLTDNNNRIYAETGALTNYIQLITVLCYNYILAMDIDVLTDRTRRIRPGSNNHTVLEPETSQGTQQGQLGGSNFPVEKATDCDSICDTACNLIDKENIQSSSTKNSSLDSPRNRYGAKVWLNGEVRGSPHRFWDVYNCLDREQRVFVKKDLKVLQHMNKFLKLFRSHLLKLCRPEDEGLVDLEMMELNFIIQHLQDQ